MPSRNELVIRAHAVGITPSNYPNDSKLEQKVLYYEKNGTTYTETKGTSVFTIAGADVAAADTMTVGNRTYTFVTALTGAKATGTLTSTGVFTGGETVTINGKTYTFRAALSSPAQQNEVLIGASAAASLDNLQSAINGGSTTYPTAANATGEGSLYSTGTVRHTDVIGHTNANDSQVVQAINYGTEANEFTTSSTSANNTWGATKMSGGVAEVADQIKIQTDAETTLDVIKDIINGTTTDAVVGTDIPSISKAHTEVTATTNTATAQTVESRSGTFDNAKIATTTTGGGNGAFGATTLASGVRGVIAVNTSTAAGSAGVSGDKNVV